MENSNSSNKVPGIGNDNSFIAATSPLYQGQGWAVFSPESFFQRAAVDKSGKLHQARIHIFEDYNTLMPWQRNDMFKLQDDVFSIVNQRAQIISGMNWKIIPSRNLEDEVAEKLKHDKFCVDQIGQPGDFDLWEKVSLQKYKDSIFSYLRPFWIKDDMSNFDQCLRQWSKTIKSQINTSSAQIEDWLAQTHRQTRFDEESGSWIDSSTQGMQDFWIQYCVDILIHGSTAIQLPNEKFDGLFILPGGTVFRIPGLRVGQPDYYVQLMYGSHGYGYQEPVWFNADEISHACYIPSSSIVNGFRPLDACMECVSTAMKYENLLSMYTNNEIPVQKLLVVVDENVTLAPQDSTSIGPQVDIVSAERTEEELNAWQKNKSVRVITEKGKDVKLIDLSRGDWLQYLADNRERIRKVIGRAFQATPNEMGETGVDSGMIAKAGAEAQAALYNQQGIKPICKKGEYQLTHEILPYRFSPMMGLNGLPILWEYKFAASETDAEKYSMAEIAARGQAMTKNEIREKILGLDRTGNEADDQTIGAPPQPQPQDLMSAIQNSRKKR